jgi:hypothetical protein
MEIGFKTFTIMDGSEISDIDLSKTTARIIYKNDSSYNASLNIVMPDWTYKEEFQEKTLREIQDITMEFLLFETTLEAVTKFEKKQILRQWSFR